MPLNRKIEESLPAVARRDQQAEDKLFAALCRVAGDRCLNYNCSVQGAGEEFAIVLSKPDDTGFVAAWWGSPESLASGFGKWLEQKR